MFVYVQLLYTLSFSASSLCQGLHVGGEVDGKTKLWDMLTVLRESAYLMSVHFSGLFNE